MSRPTTDDELWAVANRLMPLERRRCPYCRGEGTKLYGDRVKTRLQCAACEGTGKPILSKAGLNKMFGEALASRSAELGEAIGEELMRRLTEPSLARQILPPIAIINTRSLRKLDIMDETDE